MTKNLGEFDISVTKIELTHGVAAGIWLGSQCAGIIPVYEEQCARIERGISPDAWMQMDPDEKAMIIAIRRVGKAIENLQAEAELEESERKRKA